MACSTETALVMQTTNPHPGRYTGVFLSSPAPYLTKSYFHIAPSPELRIIPQRAENNPSTQHLNFTASSKSLQTLFNYILDLDSPGCLLLFHLLSLSFKA